MELENRIRFKTLISDISARIVRQPCESIDKEIERALKQVLDFFEVDRCGLLGIGKDKGFTVPHGSYADGIKRVLLTKNSDELFPWASEICIKKGQPLTDGLTKKRASDRLSGCERFGAGHLCSAGSV